MTADDDDRDVTADDDDRDTITGIHPEDRDLWADAIPWPQPLPDLPGGRWWPMAPDDDGHLR